MVLTMETAMPIKPVEKSAKEIEPSIQPCGSNSASVDNG
jgi:hypothetical protein